MKSGKKLTKDDLDEMEELCSSEETSAKDNEDTINTANNDNNTVVVNNSRPRTPIPRVRNKRRTDYDCTDEQSDEEYTPPPHVVDVVARKNNRRVRNSDRINIRGDEIRGVERLKEEQDDRRNSVEVQVFFTKFYAIL